MMIFSLGKLLILIALGYWLWRTLSLPKPAPRGAASASGPAEQPRTEGRKIAAVDLEKCPKCDAYVSVGGGGRCSRPDCPIV